MTNDDTMFTGRVPKEGDFWVKDGKVLRRTSGAWVEVHTEVVELTPYTSNLLYRAWYAEEARKRHEAEFWVGQAQRDAFNRELWRQKALEAGVPEEQADKYIYSGKEERFT
jgi:hypothetical protein